MDGNFPGWLDFAWRPENDGEPGHLDSGDVVPQGWTNWGVTRSVWEPAQAAGVVPVGTSLRDATKPQLAAALRSQVWDAFHAGEAPSGPDVMLADIFMTSSPTGGIWILHKALQDCGQLAGLDVELGHGVFGVATQQAVIAAEPGRLLASLRNRAIAYYWTLRGAANQPGWFRRRRDCWSFGLGLLK
jgi:lysozyme family protein